MHISLDSALGRQRRLNSVGESVLQIAPDAAAAYSLRSLTGGDPDVVRVRRESDNTEKDFSGSQIESGEMARWVNEQPTLPLDLRELDTNTGERDGALIEAAAAYSLRKLKEDFTGDVVEVRRNVDGDTEGFTAAEVTDGTLKSFVNASFDDELPLDQATGAAAAYSLRNLSSNGTDVTTSGDTDGDTTGKYVVQTRRSSDDAVKSFTAPEVADGTLEDWVGANALSGFYNNRAYFGAENSGDYVRLLNIGNFGTQDWQWKLKFFLTDESQFRGLITRNDEDPIVGVKANGQLQYYYEDINGNAQNGSLFPDGSINQLIEYTLTLDYDLSAKTMSATLVGSDGTSISGTLNSVYHNNAAAAINIGTNSNRQYSVGGSVYDVEIRQSGVLTNSYEGYGNTNADWVDSTGSIDGVVFGSPELFTGQGINGHVKTWYDQSGSDNHAVQTDTAKQPKIVENGTYLGEIDFDGTQYFTAISSGILTDIQDTFSAFVGTRRNNSGGYVAQASSAGGTSPRLYLRFSSATIGAEPVSVQLNGISDQEALFTLEGSSGVYNGYKNGANTEGPVTTATTGANAFTLGASSSGNSPLDGKLKEFIIYDSDQSTKRRAIEENIANHYDISLAAFSRDGTVKTWYDQTESRTDDPQNITGFLVERSNDIMNGEWDKVADVNGKVAFTHADDVNRTLNWNGTRWEFKDSSTVYYYSTVDTTYPFDVSNEWVAVEGSGTPDFESFDGGWYDPLGRGGMLTMHADVFQPTIVRNGTYLGEIDFDESNDRLNAHFELDIDPADSGFASIVVARVDSTDTTRKQVLLQNSPSGSRHLIQWQPNGRYQFYARDAEGDTRTFITNDSFGNDEYKVFTTTIDSNSLCRANVNGFGEVNNLMNESVDFSSVDSTANSDEVISPSGNPFMGAVKEMIFYLSDQSDNRTAIEANIGETYGITAIPAADDTVNGFVQTWYDQSGSGNDAEQSAASSQPKIVDGGTLIKRNNNPAVESTSDNYLGFTLDSLSADGQQSVFAVLENDVTSQDGFGAVFRAQSTSSSTGGANRRPWWFVNLTGSLVFSVDSASGYENSDRNRRLYSHIMNDDNGGTSTVHRDGTQVDTRAITLDANSTFLGGRIAGVNTNATGALYMSEVIYYDSDQSDNRPAIEANIANQYGITIS